MIVACPRTVVMKQETDSGYILKVNPSKKEEKNKF